MRCKDKKKTIKTVDNVSLKTKQITVSAPASRLKCLALETAARSLRCGGCRCCRFDFHAHDGEGHGCKFVLELPAELTIESCAWGKLRGLFEGVLIGGVAVEGDATAPFCPRSMRMGSVCAVTVRALVSSSTAGVKRCFM